MLQHFMQTIKEAQEYVHGIYEEQVFLLRRRTWDVVQIDVQIAAANACERNFNDGLMLQWKVGSQKGFKSTGDVHS